MDETKDKTPVEKDPSIEKNREQLLKLLRLHKELGISEQIDFE